MDHSKNKTGTLHRIFSDYTSRKPLTILVIDDDKAARKTLAVMLKDDHITFLEARNGADGVNIINNSSPDLVLTDLHMPGMSGFEVLSYLTERQPETPCIVISETGVMGDVIEALRLGAWDYLIKPLSDPAIVRHAVLNAWERSCLIEENREYREHLENEIKERIQEVHARALELELMNDKLTVEMLERRKSEENLKGYYDFIQKILNTIPNPIFYKAADGRYLGCNRSFEEFIGKKEEDMVGQSVFDIYEKNLADIYFDADNALFKNPGVQVYDTVIFNAKGEKKNVTFYKATYTNQQNITAGLVGVIMDVTERKEAEKRHILMATALEYAAESIIITGKDGCIQYVNPAFEKISGYPADEVLGKNPRFLSSGKHDDAFYSDMWTEILNGNVWKGRFFNKNKQGVEYVMDATISPIINGRGDITNFVAVRRDVTNELKLQKNLRQAQKMEALGTLAGGIAHDFNNILSSVIGFTELSLSEVQKDSVIYSNLKEVLAAGNRAKELVKQILTVSRRTEQVIKPIQIYPIVKEAVKLIRAIMPSTIELKENIKSRALIMGDPTQIHQVVMNLCTNAAQAMEADGGILEVGLTDMELSKDTLIRHTRLKPGQYLKLSVADTGYGIAPEMQELIFDPYVTTKEKGEGTGLGLSVVQGIVNNHEGEISVYSEPAQGAVFNVYLPIKKMEIIAEKKDPCPPPEGDECVLFVDDELSIASLMHRHLKRLGYNVETRTSSLKALELFNENPGRFDALITDMTMPGMTGDILTAKIKSIRPDIPVILCTGFSKKISEETFEAIGVNAFVMKPFNIDEFAIVLRTVLDESKNK